MKKFHALYFVGSLGFVVTALMHIAIATALGHGSLATWVPLYTVWAALIFVGVGLTIKNTKSSAAASGA